MVEEPFGMAVAEMVRGGCIVFVPSQGGPREIVGEDDRLLYDTTEEAVGKIVRVMRSHNQQIALRRFLGSRRDLFAQDLFRRRIQDVVHEFPKPLPPPRWKQSVEGR
jgi:glycosyltransferase involved in cell wall biosynthesis